MGTSEQIGNINLWLGMLAIASVVQVVALAAMAMFAYRLYARTLLTLADVERRHLEPLTRRVHGVLDGVSAQVERVKDVGDGISQAAHVVKSTVLPGWALTQGVLAAVSAFRAGGARTRRRRRLSQPPTVNTDFVNKGAIDA